MLRAFKNPALRGQHKEAAQDRLQCVSVLGCGHCELIVRIMDWNRQIWAPEKLFSCLVNHSRLGEDCVHLRDFIWLTVFQLVPSSESALKIYWHWHALVRRFPAHVKQAGNALSCEQLCQMQLLPEGRHFFCGIFLPTSSRPVLQAESRRRPSESKEGLRLFPGPHGSARTVGSCSRGPREPGRGLDETQWVKMNPPGNRRFYVVPIPNIRPPGDRRF